MSEELVEFLEWDSSFFGVRIARTLIGTVNREQMQVIETWCEENTIDCLYMLTTASDSKSNHIAEDHDFRLMDIKCTLSLNLAPLNTGLSSNRVRTSVPRDLPELKSIARTSHHDSRFYADDKFPDTQCDALFETWIENSCSGYSDVVFTAVDDDLPVGYITCNTKDNGNSEIGLLAVGDAYRRRGFGHELLQAAISWSLGNNAGTIYVTTQTSNIRALAYYQNSGFVIAAVGLWFHRWFER